MSSSILKRILEGAASRPVDPNPPGGIEEGEAVEILRLRVGPSSITLAKSFGLTADFGLTEEDLREVRDESPQELQRFIKIPLAERITQASGIYPEARAVPPAEATLGPQTRHHIEHLERQLAMERMRLKETRMQLAEMAARFGEAAAAVAQMELRYEDLDYSEIAEWVEENVFPKLRAVLGMPAGEKGGAL